MKKTLLREVKGGELDSYATPACDGVLGLEYFVINKLLVLEHWTD